MSDRKVMVAAHGHCFDGLASAALFTFVRSQLDPRPVRFGYRSCGYGPNMQVVPERWLNGEENAIVDFRYSPSERLDWYFDHHVTAFANDAERERALASGKRVFFEPTYGSCTKLIADVAASRFGVSSARYADLVEWADRIDSARFASAAAAVDRTEPVMQLAAVVEQHGDTELYAKLVPMLSEAPPREVSATETVRALWGPIEAAQHVAHERIARALERTGDVAWVDLHDAPLGASGKFVAYALAPDCVYSVSLVRMRQHFKIAVGYNPWSQRPRRHDIATLCQRHGGGGHPVVGAVSVSLAKIDDARRIARELVTALNGEP
jgi:hypothetical protein